MSTYRILKNSETKLVVQAVILADGTIRAGATKLPVVLAGECARLGLDPKKVQAAAAPVECLAKLGQNPGGIEVIAEDDYQAARTAAALAAKTPAEKDWDATVIPAIIAQDRAESASNGRPGGPPNPPRSPPGPAPSARRTMPRSAAGPATLPHLRVVTDFTA